MLAEIEPEGVCVRLGVARDEPVAEPLGVPATLWVAVPLRDPLEEPDAEGEPDALGEELPEDVPEFDEDELPDAVPDAERVAPPEAVAEKEGVPLRVPVVLGAQAPRIARTRKPRMARPDDHDVPPSGLEKLPTAAARPFTGAVLRLARCQLTEATDEMTTAPETFDCPVADASKEMAGTRFSET